MILGVVGPTSLPDHPVVEDFLTGIILRFDPDGFTSGGARGVDTLAETIFTTLYPERPTHIFHPEIHTWNHPRGFKWRNILIAETCDYLIKLAFVRSPSYGAGWTADYTEKLGKPVERYYVDMAFQILCEKPILAYF